MQPPIDAIELPDQALTNFKRWAVDTLLVRDKNARFIRIELDILYYLHPEVGDDIFVKSTHHALVANDSFLVDPVTMDAATPETQNAVGEYTAYDYLIQSGVVPVNSLIAQSILIADSRGRFS